MATIIPMPWHAVLPGAVVLDSDGNWQQIQCYCWTQDGHRYIDNHPEHRWYYSDATSDAIVPMVVPDDGERIALAIGTFMAAGFTVEPIDERT